MITNPPLNTRLVEVDTIRSVYDRLRAEAKQARIAFDALMNKRVRGRHIHQTTCPPTKRPTRPEYCNFVDFTVQ